MVGLIGLPCSGKSTFRRFLEELGARSVDADQIVRELYEDPTVQEEVARLFGPEVLRPDGGVDRSKIAERVFSDHRLLEQLVRQIIYPRTGTILLREIEKFRKSSTPGDVLVLDAPTLVESGRAGIVDRIIWVEAPDELRIRCAAERGWDETHLRRRDAAMLPPEQKRRMAHFVVENRGTLDDLRAEAIRIWQELTGRAPEPPGSTRSAG